MAFAPGDAAEGLRALPGDERLEVVLSNRLLRYALLPWSPALAGADEWNAFARHVFESTYGAEAAGWRIRVCDGGGRGKARVACAADAALVDAIAAIDRVVSLQPQLMVAFNARRAEFAAEPGWFVVHDAGRLTLGLVAQGEWKLLRQRRAQESWRDSLQDLLDREAALQGVAPCRRVVIASGSGTGLAA